VAITIDAQTAETATSWPHLSGLILSSSCAPLSLCSPPVTIAGIRLETGNPSGSSSAPKSISLAHVHAVGGGGNLGGNVCLVLALVCDLDAALYSASAARFLSQKRRWVVIPLLAKSPLHPSQRTCPSDVPACCCCQCTGPAAITAPMRHGQLQNPGT
jgi:hypothetical protein